MWRYLRGDAPWDSGIVPPEVVAWIDAHEEAGRPPGRALDLGCGTGTTSIYLAEYGWEAVGVDFAPNAIWQARRKAAEQALAGQVRFHAADVARLDFLPADRPFDLAIDIGCLHGLFPEQQASYATHLARLLRPGATYLLYAFLPRLSHDGRRYIGLTPDDVAALLGPGFAVLDTVTGVEATVEVGSAWYTIQRTDHASDRRTEAAP